MSNNKPAHFIIFKIVGILGVAIAICGAVMLIGGFGDFESNNFMIGAMLLPVGVMMGVGGIVVGFGPEIAKLRTQSTKYIQEQNKDDLTDIADTTADIMKGAVSKVAKAAKDGLEDTKYCKWCGAVIDSDSVYCNKCGKEQ